MEKGDFNSIGHGHVKSPWSIEKDSTSIAFPDQHAIRSPPNNYIVERTYCEIIQKNKPQSNSVIGGVSQLFISGLHIGWGTWRLEFREPWLTFTNVKLIILIIMSWYIFAALGGLIGAALVTKMRKKWIYYIGGTLMTVSSILFIVLYDSYKVIIIARSLAGLSHGIIYNATITHSAENAVKEIRGMMLACVNCVTFSGVFVSAILIATIQYGYAGAFNCDRILGMFGLFFSLIGIFSTIFLTYESIPFLLIRSKDSEAVVNLLKLRNESIMTTKISSDLDEMRVMVAQDKLDNQNIFTDGNASAAAKMIALRFLSTLSNNLLFNIIMMSLTAIVLGPTNCEMSPVILAGTRFCVSLIPLFSLDFFSRKMHLVVSGVGSGATVLILAIVMVSVTKFQSGTKWIPAAFCIAIQVFASLGIDPLNHLLLAEAFSTSKKSWSIAYVSVAEYLTQILLIGVYFIDKIKFEAVITILFVTAGLMLFLVLMLLMTIPETFRTTMKEARDLFRK